jgi:ammonia channel protein AmtB
MDLIWLVGAQILGGGTYLILLMQATVGLWFSADREREGRDRSRHGERAYKD